MNMWLRRTLLKAVLDERKRQLEEVRPSFTHSTHISKPHDGFDVYNKSYEVTVEVRPTSKTLTVDVLKELQHKHNIPTEAQVTVWDRGEYMAPDVTMVKFTWDDPNNIKEKE